MYSGFTRSRNPAFRSKRLQARIFLSNDIWIDICARRLTVEQEVDALGPQLMQGARGKLYGIKDTGNRDLSTWRCAGF